MSASRFDFDYDEALSKQRAAERGGPEQGREALSYWIEATSSSNHASREVRLLAGEQMPSLLRDFPEALQEVYEAGCDLSEDDSSEEVRMAGYRCMVMVAAQDSSFAGQVADVLLQLYRDTLEYKTSATEESALDGSLRSVLLSNPKSALQSFFYMIESGTPDQQKLLWDFLDGKAGKDLDSLWKKTRWDDVQGEFMQELFHAIPLADESSRPICLTLLSQLPLCTGDRAATADREYYAQLVCEEALTDPNDLNNFGRCLHLLSPAYGHPKEAQPDPRWPLLLFNHNPDQVHLWARSSPDAPREEGPSRLMDWTARGYVKMRNEIKDPSLAEGVPEYFGMRSLGADLCKASLMFMLALLPEYQTVETIRSCMQDIELYLLVSYFLWLKFNDRIPNLMDEADKEKLRQVARIAEAGTSRESGQDARRRTNVATMCKNLAKTGSATEADKVTVYPSWKPPTERSRAALNASARAAAAGDGIGVNVLVPPPLQDLASTTASDEMDVDPTPPADSLPPPPPEPTREPIEAARHPASRPIPTGPRGLRNTSEATVNPTGASNTAGTGSRGMSIHNTARQRQPAPIQASHQNAVAGPSSQHNQQAGSTFPTTQSAPVVSSIASSSISPQTGSFFVHGHAARSSPVIENFSIAGAARGNSPVIPSNASSPSSGLSIHGAAARGIAIKRKRSIGLETSTEAGPSDLHLPRPNGSFSDLSSAHGDGQRPPKRGKLSLAEQIKDANPPGTTGSVSPMVSRPSLERIDAAAQNGTNGLAGASTQTQTSAPVVPAGPKKSLLERMQGATGAPPRFGSAKSGPISTMPNARAGATRSVPPTTPVPNHGPARPVLPERADRTSRPSLKDRINAAPVPTPGQSAFRPGVSVRPRQPSQFAHPRAQFGEAPSAPKRILVRQQQAAAAARQPGIITPDMPSTPSSLPPRPAGVHEAQVLAAVQGGFKIKGRGFQSEKLE